MGVADAFEAAQRNFVADAHAAAACIGPHHASDTGAMHSNILQRAISTQQYLHTVGATGGGRGGGCGAGGLGDGGLGAGGLGGGAGGDATGGGLHARLGACCGMAHTYGYAVPQSVPIHPSLLLV